jgi:hypothetical protein
MLKEKLIAHKSFKPSQVVLTISGTECVNCYASMHYLIDALLLDSTNSLIIVNGVPKRELSFFVEEKLGLEPNTSKVIIDNDLFLAISGGKSNSMLSILKEDTVVYQSEFKNLNMQQIINLRAKNIQIEEHAVADVTSFAGAVASTFQVLNDSVIIFYNYYRGIVYEYNFRSHTITNSVGGKELTPLLDKLLAMSELSQEDLQFNKTPEAQVMLSTVPYRAVPRNIYVTENFIYLPVEVLSYDISINNSNPIPDTIFQLKWFSFFIKYDKQFNPLSYFAFSYQIPDYPGFFNYLQTSQFLNDSTLAMRVSTRSEDSLYFYYTLSDSIRNPIPSSVPECSYPDHIKAYTNGRLHVYYSQIEGSHYFFKPEPILYELNTNRRIGLNGWNYNKITDTSRTNCWIDDVQFNNDGTIYVVGTQDYSTTWLCVYNNTYDLLSRIEIINRPLIDTKITGKYIYGLDLTEEYGKFYAFEIKL